MQSICAVFDIGSNSVKLLVARRTGKAGWKPLAERTVVTGLAQGLLRSGRLQPEPIARTFEALRKLHHEALALGATRVIAAATSAVRDSSNRKEFLKPAREILGTSVLVLSGQEEARIIFNAVIADPRWRKTPVLVADIGGGSTEWILGLQGELLAAQSLPLGVVRLRERFELKYPASLLKVQTIRQTLTTQLNSGLHQFYDFINLNDQKIETVSLKNKNLLSNLTLVATGGTATILAAVIHRLSGPDQLQADGAHFSRNQLEQLLKRLSGKSVTQLRRIRGLPADRAEVILPGACVLLATLDWLGANGVEVSRRTLRDGLLLQHPSE